ncbi:sporulation protein YjcZ [Mycoplasmatota bacterium]|nr:sporulation protein YjcZ [Mycoplasmatota bacterium]
MTDRGYYPSYGDNYFAIILVLFILLAIIGCVCYLG